MIGSLSFLSPAQTENSSVEITFTLNGVQVPAPNHVTLTIEGHDTALALNHGSFAVPRRVMQADETEYFGFSVDLSVDRLHMDLPTHAFRSPVWTVLLNDRRFPLEYRTAIPNGWKSKSSCIFTFSGQGEGTYFVSHTCRTKK
jgi:hypothetical protein